ncbi:MAG TPA: 4Fe-4S binding protein [Synergistaceae bacterium]|nr:4Fe-4S binding protein [Synergistaceae bacterium]HPJ25308.1 4Fe-4S binding protein [Synergistaceae bacterium]
MRVFFALLYGGVMIAGWFYPPVALLVFGFLGTMLLLGKRKRWCSSYCPRGSFLDLVMARISPRKSLPSWVFSRKLWVGALFLMGALFIFQLYRGEIFTSFSWYALGIVLYRMCFVSSLVALPLAAFRHHRGWCSLCPVGNLLRR